MVISMEWGFCVLMRDEAVFVYCRCHSFRHRLAGCGQACIGEKDAKVSMWFTVQSHLLHVIYSTESLTACYLLYRVTHCIRFTVQSHFLHLMYSKKSLIACDLQYKSKLKIKIILVAILVYMNNQYFSHISMTSQSLIGFLSLVFWFV